jgi:V/A-type H+-transporting ATPase subunit I
MRKVTVIGHRAALDGIVERMQRAGVLDIEALEEGATPSMVVPDADVLRRLEEYRADAIFVRDFLGRHHTPTQPLSAFISEKVHVSQADFVDLEIDSTLLHLYDMCEAVSDGIASRIRERARLKALAAELSPWVGLRLQISRWTGTEHTALFAGTVPTPEGASIRQLLREVSPYVSVQEESSVSGRSAWVVLAHTSVVDEVRATLAGTGFTDVSFPDLADYPAEERAVALERAGLLETEIAALEEQARELSDAHYFDAVALAEAVEADLDAVTVRGGFGATDATFVISGWVAAHNEAGLLAALEPMGDAIDIGFAEPGPDDRPPVELRNPRLLRPFEVLTDLYGRPRYDEVDPTPLLAPFFFAFFGICIGDVGYGLMLIAGAWFIKNKLDVAPGVKKFMDLMIAGGVAAIIAGVAFASYFAWDAAELPSFLLALRIIDPMEQLETFLIFTVVLGVTQVFLGVLISAWDLARRGDWSAAVFEQLSTLFLFGMIAVAVLVPSLSGVAIALGVGLTAAFKGRAIDAALRADGVAAWDRAVGIAWLALFVVWLVSLGGMIGLPVGWVFLAGTALGLAGSKATRRIVIGLLGGVYAVYGMSSFLGDVLSYTRLAALSLSGALVGMVFNLLARLVGSGAGGLFDAGGFSIVWGVVVVVLAALVFVFGHVFNVVINLLGAFVHPARLQFVEFFSKFYEGGGRDYRPFGFRTKTLVLHADNVRQEGAGT